MGLSDDLDDFEPRPGVEVHKGECGGRRASVASGEPIRSSLELYGADDVDAEISVNGYWFEDGDDPATVEVGISLSRANIHLSLSPARARGLAAELRLAADHADEGGRDE